MKKNKNKNNSIAGIFVKSLLKSILGIIVLLTVGFVSYKVSYMILSNNSSGIGNSSNNIKDIIEDAQTDKVSKNLIYVCDDKKITHILLEICNTNTNNMDYVTIPANTDYTIPSEMYQKLYTVNEEVPQIVHLSSLKKYFAQDADAYGYGEIIIEKMIGIKISYYTVLDQETYNNHFEQVKTNLKFRPLTFTSEDDINNAGTSEQTSDYVTVSQKISVASSTYINQLKDISGDEKKIAEYIKDQYDRVDSNLTVYNKIGYIESYEKMNVDYYHYWGIPGTYSGNNFIVDTKAAKKYLTKLINNQTPYTEPQDLSKTSVSKETDGGNDNAISSVGKNIVVLNGSKITGLASSTKSKLISEGFSVNRIGDYKEAVLTRTKIIVKNDGMGQDLAKYFNDPEITVGSVEDGYDIEIILGTAEAN